MFQLYDLNLVQMRLSGAIVEVNGTLNMISDIDMPSRHYRAHMTRGHAEGAWSGLVRDLDIKYDNLRVGMMNQTRSAPVWCTRYPVRRYKVGVNSGNLFWMRLGSSYQFSRNIKSMNVASNILSVLSMMEGNYSTVDDAVDSSTGRAISQRFAIINGGVFYKSLLVGRIGDSIRFSPKNEYLQEKLEEELDGSNN